MSDGHHSGFQSARLVAVAGAGTNRLRDTRSLIRLAGVSDAGPGLRAYGTERLLVSMLNPEPVVPSAAPRRVQRWQRLAPAERGRGWGRISRWDPRSTRRRCSGYREAGATSRTR